MHDYFTAHGSHVHVERTSSNSQTHQSLALRHSRTLDTWDDGGTHRDATANEQLCHLFAKVVAIVGQQVVGGRVEALRHVLQKVLHHVVRHLGRPAHADELGLQVLGDSSL